MASIMSPEMAQAWRSYYFSFTYRYPYGVAATVKRAGARDERM